MITEGAVTGPNIKDGIVYRVGFQDLSAGIFKTAAAAAEQDVNRTPIGHFPGIDGPRARPRPRPAPTPRFTENLGVERLLEYVIGTDGRGIHREGFSPTRPFDLIGSMHFG
jgi:hypothetical protein